MLSQTGEPAAVWVALNGSKPVRFLWFLAHEVRSNHALGGRVRPWLSIIALVRPKGPR